MGWVLIHPAWNEENSAAIGARVCCWLITHNTGLQPDRMRNRYVQALYLSPGFGDFERLARELRGGRVGLRGRNCFVGWIFF